MLLKQSEGEEKMHPRQLFFHSQELPEQSTTGKGQRSEGEPPQQARHRADQGPPPIITLHAI